MGETLARPAPPPLTVSEARRRLSDTSRMSSEQVDELQAIVARFHAARPRHGCVACGSAMWSEHQSVDGNAVWYCAGCHRPASLTAEEWREQVASADAAAARRTAREASRAAPKNPARRAGGRPEGP
jgi:hypothetical protein